VILKNSDVVNADEFEQLPKAEKKRFYRCKKCGEMVDMRQLDDVLFHEDHNPRADIQYSGSKRLRVYEVRPRKDHRGFDLISDGLPFGGLWYEGPNAGRKCNRVRAASQSLT
jgi:hypothetical protein